jgi:hypothetical protein
MLKKAHCFHDARGSGALQKNIYLYIVNNLDFLKEIYNYEIIVSNLLLKIQHGMRLATPRPVSVPGPPAKRRVEFNAG